MVRPPSGEIPRPAAAAVPPAPQPAPVVAPAQETLPLQGGDAGVATPAGGSRRRKVALFAAGAFAGLALLAVAAYLATAAVRKSWIRTASAAGGGARDVERSRQQQPAPPQPPTKKRTESSPPAPARSGDSERKETSSEPRKTEEPEEPAQQRKDPLLIVRPVPPARGSETYRGLPLVRVKAPASPPKIDGDLSDPAWNNAQPLRLTWLDGSTDRPPSVETTAYVLADADKLYIAFQCMEPNMGKLKGKLVERDSSIWDDDEVEIFLLPGADHTGLYYQFIFNCRGSRLDGVNKGQTRWNPDYDMAVKAGGNYWSGEFAIRWRQFSEHRGPPSRMWRFNITRERVAGLPRNESYGWSPVMSNHSHTPARFGYAFFEAIEGSVPSDFRP
jgi:hypothetical protein